MVRFGPLAVALPTRDAQLALLLVLFIGMVSIAKARVLSVGLERWATWTKEIRPRLPWLPQAFNGDQPLLWC